MLATRRKTSMLVLAGAIAVLAAGVARALDLGPGSKALTAATGPSHAQHRGAAGGSKAHERHRAGAKTPPAGGLENGRYALDVNQQVVPVGARRLTFAVRDARTGEPVRRYDVEQTKRLHLIVIREDLTGFQHVHPRLDRRGRWTVTEAVLDRAGPWRLIADFVPAGGKQTVLASTVQATGGSYRAKPLRESRRAGEHRWRTEVAGYGVTLDAEGYAGGQEGELAFTVRRGGRAVDGLQPYLGAFGHAVLLRWGDVAYTHVHPREGAPRGGRIEFDVTYPRGAPLALFLQFRHRGKVRTAAFRLPAPSPASD